MVKEPQHISNPYSTGGGGFDFEYLVGTYYIISMLKKSIPLGLEEGVINHIKFQARYSGHFLDDIVVICSNDCSLSIQVRHTVKFTEKDSEFKSLIVECFKNFHKDDFNPNSDRNCIIVGVYHNNIPNVKQLSEIARTSMNSDEFSRKIEQDGFISKKTRDLLKSIKINLDEYVNTQKNITFNNDDLWHFFKSLVISHFDIENTNGIQYNQCLNDLKDLLEDNYELEVIKLFSFLRTKVAEYEKYGGTFQYEKLLAEVSKKFRLKYYSEINKDFSELKNFALDKKEISNIISKYKKNLIKNLEKFNFLQKKEININDIYIPLQLKEFDIISYEQSYDFDFKKHQLDIIRPKFEFKLKEILEKYNYILIIGTPGSGKTTELKKSCIDECYNNGSSLPIFIPIRSMVSEDLDLCAFIRKTLKLNSENNQIEFIFRYFLESGKLLIFIDGLDELDIKESEKARKILRKIDIDINEIISKNHQNKIIISVRKESLRTIRSEINTFYKTFEISNLSLNQIKLFIQNWFKEDIELSNQLIFKLNNSKWPDLLQNPLILTLICINFNKTLNLPSRLSRLYQQAVDIFIEDWDATRRISRYSVVELTPEKTIDLLMEIAFNFHKKGQASFELKQIIRFIDTKLKLINIEERKGREVFDELTLQYGLLCSWSIEKVYSFLHLSFQEYFVAKLLREKEDGLDYISENLNNPFWHQVVLFYAELGDSSQLLSIILAKVDTCIYTNLFLAAEILSRDPKLSNDELRVEIISKLENLAKYNDFFYQKVIDLLSKIPSLEAINLLKKFMMFEGEEFSVCTYAFKYASSIISIENILKRIENGYFYKEYFDTRCFDTLNFIPKEEALPFLMKLLNESLSNIDRFNRFYQRIWSASEKLVELGQEDSISFIISFIRNPIISKFVSEICKFCFRDLNIPNKKQFFEKLLDDNLLSIGEKVDIAGYCKPFSDKAKSFLLKVVANKKENHYRRRDAAANLCEFHLSDSDIDSLFILLTDFNSEIFFGAHAYASKALYNIESPKALKALVKALNQWQLRLKDKALKNKVELVCDYIEGYILLSDPKTIFIDFFKFLIIKKKKIWRMGKSDKFNVRDLDENDLFFIIKNINTIKLNREVINKILEILVNTAYNITIREQLLNKILTKINLYIEDFYYIIDYLFNNLNLEIHLHERLYNIEVFHLYLIKLKSFKRRMEMFSSKFKRNTPIINLLSNTIELLTQNKPKESKEYAQELINILSEPENNDFFKKKTVKWLCISLKSTLEDYIH